jgi:molybdopterin synthase catalytic subunit
MANFVCEVLLTNAPLRPPENDPLGVGAVVDFSGIVRSVEDGREIDGIEYEAHREMADHQLRQIADQVFLRVTSLHREEAFRASQWIVNELKKKVPIWKRPRFKMEKQHHAAHRAAAKV